MSTQLKIVELFSGIGSQAKALRNIGADIKVVATCEWDIHAIVAYDAIHNRTDKIEPEYESLETSQLNNLLYSFSVSADGKKPMSCSTIRDLSRESKQRILSAIKRTNNLVNIQKVNGKDLPGRVDIMTYSFPCQDLSNVGALHGYKKGIARDAGNRSCMLWEVERILKERKENGLHLPKFLVMENVPTLLSDRHRNNFEEWISVLNELGYHSKYFCLNALQFGCPQNRYRMLMISTYIGQKKEIGLKLDDYYNNHNLEKMEFQKKLDLTKTDLRSCLHIDYSNKRDYNEALECQPNDTPSRKKIWDDNLKIVGKNNVILTDHVATITTKQDRHPNSGNIWFDPPNNKSRYRFLTPRECFQIMGFQENDYDSLIEYNCFPNVKYTLFSRDKVHRLAGNSIPVKLLEAVFSLVLDIQKIGIARTAPPKRKPQNIKTVFHDLGLSFKSWNMSLPGTSNYYVKKYKTIIQVRDCIMLHHNQCEILSKARKNFASPKNKSRSAFDEAKDAAITKGYNVIRIWKCEIDNGACYEIIKRGLMI